MGIRDSPEDSKLYYLITRYYDPETGRFISPDGIEYLAPEQLNGLNLYAYCNNNPVMNIDPSGHFWFTFFTTVIGGIVGIVAGIVDYALNNDGEFQLEELLVKAGAGFAAGATAGFVLGITKGAGIATASYASAAVYSLGNETGSYILGDKEFNLENIGKSIVTIVGDTLVNGTINYISNSVAANMVPTNSGWFAPKKFFSYFTKTFGQRMMAQTVIAGSLTNWLALMWKIVKEIG